MIKQFYPHLNLFRFVFRMNNRVIPLVLIHMALASILGLEMNNRPQPLILPDVLRLQEAQEDVPIFKIVRYYWPI